MKSRLLILLFTGVCLFVTCSYRIGQQKFFEWDKNGYYLYLPAAVIYNDLGHFSFYDNMQALYQLQDDEIWYIHQQPNGKKLNKYGVGTALFELPFFLVAHIWCTFSATYPADGYSIPYRYAVIFSNIFWVVCGLFLLRKLLRKYYNDIITLITLACIALGTNLYTYTAYDQGLSHPYSFFLFSAILLTTHQYYTTYNYRYLYVIAICLGLITITRPVNIIVAVLPLLWGVCSMTTLKQRIVHYRHIWLHILFALALFLVICLLQMGYWKYATGHWVYFSYEGEGFVFTDPEIWKGLFSYRKGWFVYTPVAFIALLGFYSLSRQHKKLVPAIALFFCSIIYITFSWYNWYYGGSFGCRPLIDILPILSLPLTAIVCSACSSRAAVRVSFTTILVLLIALNMFQSYQFAEGIIPVDKMTKAYYWRIFGKTTVTDEDREYMMNDREYWQGIKEMAEKVQKKK